MKRQFNSHWFLALILTLTCVSLSIVSTAAKADETADVSRLIHVGLYAEAQQKADAFLAQNPKNAQMRFLKGLILAEQNKTNEAIIVFVKLTEDYPELPEPYNNLAVLYASTNQLDKARASLEMAIKTNPSYGTAHENLGDIYAKMASQAYDKALQLDSGNSAAKVKLTLIRNLFTNPNSAIASNSTPKQPQIAQVNPKVPAPAPKAEPAKPTTTVAAATPPVKPEPAKPSVKTDVKTNNNDESDVLAVVNAWANAWSNKNTNGYLSYYGKDFQLPKGATRKSWSDERRVRIEGKGRISVKVDSPQVTINGTNATVKFRQIYNSDKLKADSRKTLVLTKQEGKWQISQERTGG